MASERKPLQRDQALIGILERLAGELRQQDETLASLSERQNNLATAIDSTGINLRGKQVETQQSYDKLYEAISHYRSNMLSLVNEQDRITKDIEELRKAVKTATYALDITNQKLIGLDERLSGHEKSSNTYYQQAGKQSELFQNALIDSGRSFAKLHTDTEKHLAELHNETARQLDKFQHETLRRLLLLDGIVTSLQTLLVRTEPRKKKPLWIVRAFARMRVFFKYKVPSFFMKRK
ncbi:MAG: hypothetical protein FWH17_09400 [Oscillospiraceae bacterium]|nr:hypothetical protein [Oscillospiraceae bacterium]